MHEGCNDAETHETHLFQANRSQHEAGQAGEVRRDRGERRAGDQAGQGRQPSGGGTVEQVWYGAGLTVAEIESLPHLCEAILKLRHKYEPLARHNPAEPGKVDLPSVVLVRYAGNGIQQVSTTFSAATR